MPINLQVRAIYTSKIEQTQINYHIRVHYFAQLKPLKIPKRRLENPIKLPNKTDNLISKPGASFEQGSTIIRILHPTKINKTQIDWYCNESRVFYVNRAPIKSAHKRHMRHVQWGGVDSTGVYWRSQKASFYDSFSLLLSAADFSWLPASVSS